MKKKNGGEKMEKEFNRLIGRCQCGKHAEGYVPRSYNQSRTYYFIPEEYLPVEFLCGACRGCDPKLEMSLFSKFQLSPLLYTIRA
jgi:hypothetical protein